MSTINKKIYNLFNNKEKIQYIWLRILSVFGSFLDMLSVSLILPLVYLITDEKENDLFKRLLTRIIPNLNSNQYLIIVVLLLVVIFILKNVFLSFEYYAQSNFTNKCKKRVKKQIYDSFLFRPYEQFIKYSSGEIISTVNENCEDVFLLIYRYLIMQTEITVSIIIFIYLFILDYKMTTIIVLLLVVEVVFIFFIIDPIIKKTSRISYQNSTKLRTWVHQTFNGIKEVKISSKIKNFSNTFNNYSENASDAKTRYDFLSSLPRNIIEAVSVSCILLYILFFINTGNVVSDLIPHLSAFAVALIRLLPSFNRISNAKTAISYYENKLDNIIEQINNKEVTEEEKQNNIQITFNDRIEMKDIYFKYSDRDNVVIDNGQLEIKYGSFVGIVGPSGAGKTTLIDILLGLLKPQKGVILSDGKSINESYKNWISNIGYIPQNIFIMNSSIKENIGFGLNKDEVDDDRVVEVLKQAQLFDFVMTLKDGINTIIGESGIGLSGGQKQRIGIARALYNDPQILIFDEATSSLDADTEKEIMESINKLHHKKTIIVITHKSSIIQNSDIIYRIENKKIYREK